MIKDHKYFVPILAYLVIIIVIFLLRKFLDFGLVLSVSATLLLVVPYLLKKHQSYFNFNLKGFIKGVVISLIVIAIYLIVIKIYTVFTHSALDFERFSNTGLFVQFLMVQLLLVAIPEEIFFRAYLQREFGNTIRAVVIVSVLFSIAHLTTICIAGGVGFNTCGQNFLTFFPSLVMGYLYVYTGTIWSSIFFHFIANVAHIILEIV